EAGVDEPDVAKLMGDYVVSLRNRTLVVTDVSGAGPVEVSKLRLRGGFPEELLVVGDRVVVTGTRVDYAMPTASVRVDSLGPAGFSSTNSTLTTVDLGDPATPEVVSQLRFQGTISTA